MGSIGIGNSEYHTQCVAFPLTYTLLSATFITNQHSLSLYTAPVINTVTTESLSLSDVQVTVTLSDNGGQPVEEYTVSLVQRMICRTCEMCDMMWWLTHDTECAVKWCMRDSMSCSV